MKYITTIKKSLVVSVMAIAFGSTVGASDVDDERREYKTTAAESYVPTSVLREEMDNCIGNAMAIGEDFSDVCQGQDMK